jgi:hypothetical protein
MAIQRSLSKCHSDLTPVFPIETRLAAGHDKLVLVAAGFSTDLLVTNAGDTSVRNRVEDVAARQLEAQTTKARKLGPVSDK